MKDEELCNRVSDISDRLWRVDRIVWFKKEGREKPEDGKECLRLLAETTELIKKFYEASGQAC